MNLLGELSNSELRLATRLLNTLRKDHGVHLGYRDPKLGYKLCSALDRLCDPVLNALWGGVPEKFRGPALEQWEAVREKRASSHLYRGQTRSETEPPSHHIGSSEPSERVYRGAAIKNEGKPEPKPEQKGGKYIIYRGTKQWVPD